MDGYFDVSNQEINTGTDCQLIKDKSNRWWLVKQRYLSGENPTARLVMAIPFEEAVKGAIPSGSLKLLNLVLSSTEGTVLYGKEIPPTADPIIIPIYLDGLNLNFLAYPENGWSQLGKGKNLGFQLIGLLIIIGMTVLVFLILKRQEKLNLGIQKRAQALELEFNQRLLVEDDLDKSKAALVDATRRAHIGLWECDVLTDEFHWSDELYRIIEETPVSFIPTIESFTKLIHPEDLPTYLEGRQFALHDHKSSDFELRIIKPNKTISDIWITINPKLSANGNVESLWGIAQDISLIKSNERQLKDSNRILQMITECDQVLVRAAGEQELLRTICRKIVELGDYQYVWVGIPESTSHTGFQILSSYTIQPQLLADPTLAINKYTGPILHKAISEQAPMVWSREEERTATGRKVHLKKTPYQYMAAFPVQLSESSSGILAIYDDRPPIFGEAEILHLRQLADDLSFGIQSIRRKDAYTRTLEALQISESKFAKAFHTSPDAITITRLIDGEYIDVNEGFCSITGYTRDDIIGKKLADLSVWVDLSDRDKVVTELQKKGEVINFEAQFKGKGDRTGTGLFSARLIEIDGEKFLLSIARDISERIQGNRALKESEERYRIITENMAETVWLMDMNLRTTFVSPSVEKNRGFTFEEIKAMPIDKQLTPESYQLVMKIVGNELSPTRLAEKELKISALMEVQFYKKDGSIEWSEVVATLVRNSIGDPQGILCVGRNITDRKRMEEALRLSEERWQFALEGSGEGVWDWDLETNQVFFSRRWKEMLGYSEIEFKNSYEEWIEHIHSEDKEKTIQAIQDHIRGNTPDYNIEFRMQCQDGSYKWISGRGKVIAWTSDGKALRIVGTHTDMTVSKMMQSALEESEKSFRLLAERSNDMISRILPDGTIVYVSPACERIVGYIPEEIINHPLIDMIHPEDKSIVSFVLEQAQTSEESYPLQYRLHRKDGSYVWVESIAAIVRDAMSDSVIELQITIRDITERIAAETALRQSEEKLRSLITQSADGIVLTDEEGFVIEWSKGQEQITGLYASDVLGKYIWDIEFQILPKEARNEEEFLQIKSRTIDLLSRGAGAVRSDFLERQIELSEGKRLFIQTTYFPIQTPSGFMTGAITRDVTAIKAVEKALKDSEEKLRYITDNMLDMVTLVDQDWVITYTSPSVKNTLGYDPNQVIGTPIFSNIHSLDRQLVMDRIFHSVHQAESRVQVEYRYQNSFGVYLWMESLVNLMYDKSGVFRGAIFGTRDISDRKFSSDALRESESRYRTLVRNFPNGAVMLFDSNLRNTVADGAGLEVFGLEREKMEGQTIFEIFQPEIATALEPHYRSVLTGRTEIFELPLADKVVQFYVVPISDDKGTITSGMVMTQDVTDRKIAIQALSERAQYLGSLNEITRSALETTELKPFVQHIVELVTSMFHADICAVTSWDEINRITVPMAASGPLRETYPTMQPPPGQRTLTEEVLDRSAPLYVPDMQNSEFIHSTLAKLFPTRSVLTLPLLGGGRKLGAVLIGFDEDHNFADDEVFKAEQVAGQVALGMYKHRLLDEIRTSNQELEHRVAERTADLEAKNKELETFTYSVSHDLKAPLRGIEGYSRLLIEDHADQLGDEAISFLQTIRSATNQMNQLIEDLLSYSRLERRALTSDKLDLKYMVDHLIKERQADIDDRPLQIMNEIPSIFIQVDQRAIDQALRNLLDNAIKFTRNQNQPKIHFSLTTNLDTYIISVSDNGIGFDMKYRERIFDIFQRLHLADDYPGTGIGLALVKKAMQRIGGKAWATSKVGQGSTFYLEFPKEG